MLIPTLITLATLSQAPLPEDNAIDAIAPGKPVWAGSMDCSTSTTVFLEYDFDGAGGWDDILAIPDKSIVTVANQDSTNVAICALVESPFAVLGDDAGAATRFDIDDRSTSPNGDKPGAAFSVGPFQQVSFRADHFAMSKSGGARTGLCSTPVTSTRDRVAEGQSTYISCVSNDECDGVAGITASSTCLTSSTDILAKLYPRDTSTLGRRSMFLGCRCGSTNRLDVMVWR